MDENQRHVHVTALHFLDATARIQNHYRRILDRRRMAKVEASIVRALRVESWTREEYATKRSSSFRTWCSSVVPAFISITHILIDPTTTNTGTHRATRTSTLLAGRSGSHEL